MRVYGKFQKAAAYILTFGFGVCLVLTWVVTAPLFSWGDYFTAMYRRKFDGGDLEAHSRFPKFQ